VADIETTYCWLDDVAINLSRQSCDERFFQREGR
jgi:hypothetical protein